MCPTVGEGVILVRRDLLSLIVNGSVSDQDDKLVLEDLADGLLSERQSLAGGQFGIPSVRLPQDVKHGRDVLIGIDDGFSDQGVNSGIRHNSKYRRRPDAMKGRGLRPL